MGYTARDVARMLDLSVGQVRAYARAGFLDPGRGPRGEYRFSFQDLVLLRTAKGLTSARIPPRQVRSALRRLKQQLPVGRPLSGVQIEAFGNRIIVRHGSAIWNPESGQVQFDFDMGRSGGEVQLHAATQADEIKNCEDDLDPEDWFALGSDLESAAPEHSREAYRRVLELDPHHVDARVNLGRLLHEAGQLHAAEANYRLALAERPENATALFNLGVSLEDLGHQQEAIESYRHAISAEPDYADAYYNLARLLEQTGDRRSAIRFLKTYRKLTEEH